MTLHYTTLHYITPHYIILHYITLHITLHYTTLSFTLRLLYAKTKVRCTVSVQIWVGPKAGLETFEKK